MRWGVHEEMDGWVVVQLPYFLASFLSVSCVCIHTLINVDLTFVSLCFLFYFFGERRGVFVCLMDGIVEN